MIKKIENLFIPDAGVSNEPLYNDRGRDLRHGIE